MDKVQASGIVDPADQLNGKSTSNVPQNQRIFELHELDTYVARGQPQTSHNIDCALGPLLYKSVFHLNSLTAQLSYEGRAAVEGGK
jgi:hypothetical protein